MALGGIFAPTQPVQSAIPSASTVPSAPVQASSQPAQQASGPSWWEKALPTAGGILGGIGGEALDVFGGGVAGASAGDALGKYIENKLTGQAGGNGVVGSAIEGGVGQGLGGLAGKAISGVLGSGVSPLAEKASTGLLQGQFKGTLDAPTAKVLSDMGITDARQISDIAPLVTQSNGALSTGVKQALADSADNGIGVDITGLDTTAKNVLAEHGAQQNAIDTVGNNLTNSINNMVNPEDISKAVNKQGLPTYAYTPGALQNALPEDVFKQSQKMDQLASQAYNKAYDKMGNVTNVEELTKGQTYSKVADELESRAFGTNPGQNPLLLSDSAKSNIIKQLAPVKDINPQTYQHYVDAVNQANTVQELRPLQSSMVNASKAYDSMQRITAKGGGLSGSDIARGAVGLAHSPAAAAAGLVLNNSATDRAGAAGLSKVAGLTSKNSKLVSKIIPLATKAAGVAAANLPSDVSQPTNNVQSNSAIPAQGVNPMQPQTAAPGVPGAVPPQNYNSILDSLMQLGILDPSQYGSMASSVVAPAIPGLQKGAIAGAQLQGQQAALANAGGPQGFISGLISKATGLIPGTPQAALNSQTGQLANTLGISPNAVPNVMQTPGTAGIQTTTLQDIINAMNGGAISAIPGGYAQ